MDHSDVPSPSGAERPNSTLPVTDELLSRYLAGAVSPTERVLVEQRINTDPELATFVENLRESQRIVDRAVTSNLARGRELLAERVGFAPQHLSLRAPQAVRQNVPAGQSEVPRRVAQTSPKPSLDSVARRLREKSGSLGAYPRNVVAAAIGCVAVVLAIVGVPNVRKAWHSRGAAAPTHTYSAKSGQRVTVTLGDGSTVLLAPETRLSYTVDPSGARVVELDGEAFFRVKQRAEQPFTVRTGTVVTKVLGTEFNVRRYAADSATQVAVLTGRVASGGHGTPLVLAAGTVGRITDSSATLSLNDDPELVASWTQGHLVFHNAPVATVLTALSRWYGYEFRSTDTAITAGHISVRLSTDRANEALNMVKTVLGVTMTFEGNIITLRPERGEQTGASHRRTHELSVNPEPEVGR